MNVLLSPQSTFILLLQILELVASQAVLLLNQ